MIQPYWGELDTMGDSLIGKSFLHWNWRQCFQISHRCPWNIGIPKWNKNQYFAHWNNLRFCYQISYRCLRNTEISNWNKNRFSPSEINTVVCMTITPQYQRRNNRKIRSQYQLRHNWKYHWASNNEKHFCFSTSYYCKQRCNVYK